MLLTRSGARPRLRLLVCGWTFAVYEHRNSDAICVEGCRDEEVKPYGPYSGEDKYDVLYDTKYRDYEGATEFLVRAMKFVKEHSGATREQLKGLAKK